MYRTLIIAITISVISCQVAADIQLTDDDEIVWVQKVPVDAVYMVERADGNIFYISGDQRFTFVGAIFDLWTGKDILELDTFNQMNWSRAGVSPDQLIHSATTSQEIKAVLFLSRDCKDCSHVIQRLQPLTKSSVGLSFIQEKAQFTEPDPIWCEGELTLAIVEEYVQNRSQDGVSPCFEHQAARANAFADIFGLTREQPVLIDTRGFIFHGSKEIKEWFGKRK